MKEQVSEEGGTQSPHGDVDFPKPETGLEPQSSSLQPSSLKEEFSYSFFTGLKEKQKMFESLACLEEDITPFCK